MPNGKYKGQKLIKLVRIKIPARIKRIIATVPEITLVKYSIIIAIATSILVTLSAIPIFGVIYLIFKIYNLF
jgi:hypothetical protein